MDNDCHYCDTPEPETTTPTPSVECPHEWLDLGHHGCLQFFPDAENMNWFEAQVYCNNLNSNAYLAEIYSEETQLVVAALASELEDCSYWLGASDFYKVKLRIMYIFFVIKKM